MEYYIYAHVRPDTNEIFYIGKGKGKRAKERSRRNKIWRDIVNKNNGLYNILFLHTGLSEQEAFSLELKLIREKGRICNNSGSLSNLTLGGEGSSGYLFTDEHKKKISKSLSGDKHPLYGKKHSLEHISKMSTSLKGKIPWNKGIKHSELTKDKIRKKAIGRPNKNKGIPLTEEHKKLLSKAKKGKITFQSKKIRNTKTNEIIALSATDLYNKVDCNNKSIVTIHAYLNGNTKKPDWFHYEYVKDEISLAIEACNCIAEDNGINLG